VIASSHWGPVLEADKTRIAAGIAALEGRSVEALAGFRDALRAYQQLGVAFDEAAAVVDMAILLPSEALDAPDAVAAVSAARVTLTRLGAAPYLARLEQALSAERTGGHAPATAAAPDKASRVASR
jgi:hypothetical protein